MPICLHRLYFLLICLSFITLWDVLAIVYQQEIAQLGAIIAGAVTIIGYSLARKNNKKICLGRE